MGGLTSDVVLLLHCDGSAGTSVLTEHQYGVKLTPRVQLGSITAGGKWAQYLGLQQTSLQFLAFSAPMVLDLGWSTPFTIDFWCYTVTSYQVGRTAVMWECTNAAGTSLFRTVLGGYGGDSGPHQLTYLGSTMKGISALSTLVWQHWAFVRTASCFGYFFVNGVKVGSAGPTSYNMSIATTQSYFWFGRYWGLEHLTGVIEEFRIVNGVAMWESDFTPPTDRYNPELPIAEMDFLASNVQPLFVQNQSLQIANRFRYDTVRKIPDMSAAQVRAVLMSAGYTFDPDNDHDFDSVSANSIASVRLYPTITEDDTSDVTSVYFSDIPWSGPASTVGMVLAVAKDFTSMLDSRIVLLLHFDGAEGATTITDSAKGHVFTQFGSAMLASRCKFGSTGLFMSYNSALRQGFSAAHSINFVFTSEDFTIDLWAWLSGGVSQGHGTIGKKGVGQYDGWAFVLGNSLAAVSVMLFQAAWPLGNSAGSFQVSLLGSSPITYSMWNHFAVTKEGSIVRLFSNGGIVVSQGGYSTLGSSSEPLKIGDYNSNYFFKGHLDEIRIVKGAALWTSNFTVYTAAYSESAIWSGETIVGFLSIEETIPSGETLTAKGVSVRLT